MRLKLGKIQPAHCRRRIACGLTYDEALVDAVAARCTEVESGARNVDNILTNTLLPEISHAAARADGDGRGHRNDHRRRRATTDR